MTIESNLIDQHIGKLRFETATVAGKQRMGHFVAGRGSNSSFFIAVPDDNWAIAHVPSARLLVRGGLTRRDAFMRAEDIFKLGLDAGLGMHDPLPRQLAARTLEERKAMQPDTRAYIEMLEQMLAGS